MSISESFADVREQLNIIGQGLHDVSTTSLSEAVRDAMVMSRVYVQSSLADEDIMPPMMQLLNQIYVGYIITALQMNSFVSGSRRLRDITRMVATESYIDVIHDIDEAFMDKHGDKIIGKDIAMEAKFIELDGKQQKLASGRVVEIEFSINSKDKVTLTMFVQLLPIILNNDVIKELVKLNSSPSLGQRWNQMRAGEISFIKDFLFELDTHEKRRKAMKNDRTNTLYEIMNRNNWGIGSYLLNVLGTITGLTDVKYNLASSILIMEKNSFDKACYEAGLNFKKPADRNRFFKKSMMFFVVVVDTSYNSVDIYYTGLEHIGTYTYKQIESGGKSADTKFDLKDILGSFAQGQAPTRF